MTPTLIEEILGVYERHGWSLRRVLLRPDSLANLTDHMKAKLGDVPLVESDFDALWFARPSHSGREAWELRLLSDTPYALFESFAGDETEEQRENKRRGMEARIRLQQTPKI